MSVPKVLLQGNHKEIKNWRLEKRLDKTLSNRPDLLEEKSLDLESQKTLQKILKAAKRT
jgi:tRNA (guanine37-N1)-methyltransferase